MMGYLTNEVGIDGMLIAPGYQYSQIDPALTMTRAEHEEKFRRIRAAAREHGYRWLASPIYQDFLTGERKLAVRAVGLDHAQPVRLEGPVLPAHGRHLPDLRRAARGHRVGDVRAGQRPALRALRDPLRLRAVGGLRGHVEHQGDRPEHGLDADGMTLACATGPEERAARRLGADGAGRARGPQGRPGGAARLVRARRRPRTTGSLRRRARRDARRRRGREGALGGRAARASRARATATILAADAVVDDPAERRRLHERTGADAVDMESGAAGAPAGSPAASARSATRRRVRSAPLGRWRVGPTGGSTGAGSLGALVPAPRATARALRRPCARSTRCRRTRVRRPRERPVLLAAPRSFCAGVDRAIEIVERLLEQHGPPIYVRHEIVHNDHVVRRLERLGAVFVDDEDEVPPGEICVLSAHGVAPGGPRELRAAGAARRRRRLPARLEGARRGAPLRGQRPPRRADRPRRPRRGDRDEGRAAGRRSSSSSRPRTRRSSTRTASRSR